MALKLLMVDDEPSIIRRIQNRLDWSALGIGEIRTAQDGVEALELCQDWQPDILISDVRMPRMDGIHLAEALRKTSSSLQIIFISGYSDKEYLKNAIHLKAVNYIEKPIDWEECQGAVKDACDEILRRDLKEKELSVYRDEHLSQLQSSLALALSSSRYSQEESRRLVEEIFPASERFSYCVALQLLFYREEERTLAALTDCLPLLCAEAAQLSMDCCAAVKYNYIVVFLFVKKHPNGSEGYHVIDDYTSAVAQKLSLRDLHFTLGVGRFSKKWEELPSSWQDAQKASSQAFYHGLEYISYYRSFATQSYDFSSSDPAELVRGIRKLPKVQFVFTIRSVVSELRRHEGTPSERVKRYFFSLMLELRRIATEDGASVWPDLPSEHELLVQVMAEAFLDDLLALFLEGVDQYYLFLETDFYDNATVNWIIRHVHQNYADPDLSVTTISSATNLSTTYICHLFKDVTGCTLHNYITEYRMQKAAQLIRDPLNRVSKVAEMVGYRNGNYFSFRFRKSFGLSPSEYKEQNE